MFGMSSKILSKAKRLVTQLISLGISNGYIQ